MIILARKYTIPETTIEKPLKLDIMNLLKWILEKEVRLYARLALDVSSREKISISNRYYNYCANDVWQLFPKSSTLRSVLHVTDFPEKKKH